MAMNNRVVLVTGAGNGIGAEVSSAFAKQGDRVIVTDLNEADAKRTQKQIVDAGGQATAYTCDVSKPEQIQSLMNWIDKTFGRLDVCINNAGISKWISPLELSVEDWDKVMNTNARGTFLCSREAAKMMKEQNQGGSIVNISSTRAAMSEPNSEAYAASKGAIVSLTHALAASLQEEGIQVNSISPGWIHTGDDSELREIDHNQHFSKRVGEPSDIARACLFLTDPKNTFITGENLTIDGGMTKKMIYEH
ncbi:SDR family NAD(P)-dependent oxidoreductase [Alkalicoccobacillus plakortidis]|jgi:NAD(P)-dependent dehydrogenase (short-subunit alcohol dehydrogenase family)|uniref:SDR family oxidoreductase n=1 Tax=Alkalicoccobacillus plakortidis TaxID=444060 RepID=A0ABT0XEB2_9BACI|nr:SDR family oxidoreductase [Alkalicoccobacillus plakortidis]MCM2674199.1 SDR family oxidoreductase [Alkalicoccobacillus plakortidis]